MGINSTNINKINMHISSHLNSLNTQRPRHMTLEIQVLTNDRGAKICSEKNFTAKTVEILEKGNIDIHKTQIHAGSLSWLDTDTSIKNIGAKVVFRKTNRRIDKHSWIQKITI